MISRVISPEISSSHVHEPPNTLKPNLQKLHCSPHRPTASTAFFNMYLGSYENKNESKNILNETAYSKAYLSSLGPWATDLVRVWGLGYDHA